ncbi:Cobalt-precorrin-3 C(17)-methyltransferase [Candidatus Syntrophocurvum alkaliphilum]|uniref:Cobalt-precorrin-3 C(17)-methyltransferase n=1 Tax=Candidatus Syntrophocurvum alkaliphilum TaxID=2293317 RepID=A0A6I6DH11_9FIRM|nr:Cobalt-precorrin-3 C(17)-methyltransferase [Candidatus Syntrophocurvum alkaliphilum]
MGPGDQEFLAGKTIEVIKMADAVVGYKSYVKLIENLVENKKVVSSGMKQEQKRAEKAIELANEGKNVVVVSSGDPGIYGMAGLLLELTPPNLEVEIIPGITAASAAASILGAPLINDFAVVSLSDLLTPWELINKRLNAAGQGDFAIVLYNPRSQGRREQIEWACEILLKYKDPKTPVGIVRNAKRGETKAVITTLGKMLQEEIDMLTTVIIGNSDTRIINGKMVTARGYK